MKKLSSKLLLALGIGMASVVVPTQVMAVAEKPRLGGIFAKESNVFYLVQNLTTLWLCAKHQKDHSLLKKIKKAAIHIYNHVGGKGNVPVDIMCGMLGLEGVDKEIAIDGAIRTLKDYPTEKRKYINVGEPQKSVRVVPIRDRRVNTVYWKGDHRLREVRKDTERCSEMEESTGADYLYGYWLSKMFGVV